MKTADAKFIELCDEIDYWKAEAEHWKAQYIKERDAAIKEMNERLEDTKKGVADALMLAFSVRDTADGGLMISADDRKVLADRYK